ncbi:MAG TPA: hypothetical protein DDY78_00435 [Planctomycetales bacterium]|jgi:hypothetical protein|nr:hypothetical protein [Planctomycetales bacterium]
MTWMTQYYYYLECAQETMLLALYLTGLIVCVRNRRVSRWTGLVLTGFAVLVVATPISQLVWQVLRFVSVTNGTMTKNASYVLHVVMLLQSLGKVVGMGLVVTGLGLVLIDLGRRLGARLRESVEVNQPALSRTEAGMS